MNAPVRHPAQRRGRLLESATVDLERIAIVPSVTARGLYARYHLRTDVSYEPEGIRLLEQLLFQRPAAGWSAPART